MKDLTIGVDRNGACAFEDAIEIGALHFAARDRRDAVRRLRTNVASGDAGIDGSDFDTGHRLRSFDRVFDRTNGPVDVRDDPFSQSAAWDAADAEDGDPVCFDLTDDRADLRGPDVEADDDFAV